VASNTIKGLTVEIGGDTTKLGKAIKDVEAKSRSLSKELGDINKLLKLDPGNTELLAQKQKVLGEAAEAAAKKLDTLREAERQVQQQFERGEVSEEQLRALQREIVATENKMKGYEKAAKQTGEQLESLGRGADEAGDGLGETGDEAKKSAKKVDDFADAADDAEKSSGNLGSTLASAAKTGFAAVAAAAAAAITGLVAAAESTREYRTEMGKLDTAFTQNGHSSEAALGAYKELQGILGDTDQAVEAANHLAKLTDNEKDLATWTGDILPGLFATFGASLPIEGLTEAANETAKVGKITGPMADAINWATTESSAWTTALAGNSDALKAFNKATKDGETAEDAFNAALATCSTEQERQALITQTLASLYGKTAAAYKETNAEVIRANQANDAWMQSLAGVGGAIEPIITDIKLMGASLLSEAVPGVQALAEAFRGMMNGEEGAAGDFAAAISSMVSGLVSKITEALPGIAQVGLSIITTLATSLVQQLPTLLSTGGQIVAQLLSGIATNLPSMAQGALNALSGFVSGLQTNLPLVLAKGREILLNLATGIKNNLPSLVSQALDIVMNFAQTIYDNAPTLIETGFDVLSNLVEGILGSLPVLLSKAPEIISKFANVINDNFPTILKKGAELIWQIITGIIGAIPDLIANVPKIITAIVDVWEAFNWLNLGKKAITALKDGVLKMVGAVKTAGTKIMNTAVNAVKNLPTSLANFGKNAANGLGNALRSGVSTIKSGATQIFNGVLNTIKGLPAKLLTVGKDLVKGLWNGISDMTGWIVGKIQGFGDSVLSGIKKFFGIKSPSKVMAKEVGRWLPAGMADGIEGNTKTATRSMIDMAQDALAAANAELSGASLAAPTFNGLAMERGLQHRAATVQAAATPGAGMLTKLDAILAAIERGQVILLDGKALVGATAPGYDNTLGQRRALVARGAL
jgi:phage-related minor tail protein